MRITLITQSDPFFLADSLDHLLSNIPQNVTITSAVVTDVSPFGKSESLVKKALRTYRVFGPLFFINYSLMFLKNSLNKKKSVKYILKKHNVDLIELNHSINHKDSLNDIKLYSPDLLVSIAGNQIFKQPLLDLAPKGCINLHTALLPKYRGLLPSFWVLKNNEKETGVSVFFVNSGIDSGPILVQIKIPITINMSQEELIRKSKILGMEAVIESISLIYNGGYSLLPNPDNKKTYYSFPTREDVKEFYKKGKRFF